ncbi:unnamed protein product [Pedinophyceae sp. YPF-701]|nr:unnamed protein product [Pedinophyceae sp. YPF-701]
MINCKACFTPPGAAARRSVGSAAQRADIRRSTTALGRSVPAAAARTAGAARRAGRCSAANSVQAKSQCGNYDYDLVTIGGGSGGVRGSRFASSYGASVALVEMPFGTVSSDTVGGMGGTCVLRGCVPKKLLVYASEFNEHFKDSVGYGFEDRALPAHSWETLIGNKNKELQRLNNVYGNIIKNAGVEHFEGRATIAGPNTIEIAKPDGSKTQVTTKHILIATGGRPRALGIPGGELAINSDHALELDARPDKIAIVGGGYIGLEFACIFNGLGSEVYSLMRSEGSFLRGFDNECRTFLKDQMTGHGVNIMDGWEPVEIRKRDDGKLDLDLKSSSGETKTLEGLDQVMCATGRDSNSRNLGLETVGVEVNKRGDIVVDEYSRTTAENVWAVGDVTNRINLTPVALMEGMAFAATAFADKPTKPDHSAVASAVFTQPSLTTVGMSEEEAVESLGDVDVYTSSYKPMRNTLAGNEGREMMKLVVDAKTDKVVGVHMVGHGSSEIVQGFAVVVKAGVTKTVMDSTVGIHPSSAEEFVTMRSVSRQYRGGKLQE